MAVSTVSVRLPRRRFGETARRDVWWIQPLLVLLGLSTFVSAGFFRIRKRPHAVLLSFV